MSCKVMVQRRAPLRPAVSWPSAEDPAALPGPGAGPAMPPAAQPAPPPASGVDVQEARQAAFREGEAAGRAQAQAEIRKAVERLAHGVQELSALRPRLRQQAEKDLVRLAVAVARRVLRRELTVDSQAVEGLVKASLERLAAEEVLRVRVHPAHESVLRTCLANGGRADRIEVIADPALECGGVVFETAHGDLDASVGTQLAEIERGLTDRLGRMA
ncbi:MAG TPA: FliH/SctL family protein [Bryobacteraceae bacterium]|nr:FliH/SctL family protein [Bryobacteraceae bacterium]